MKKLIVANWKMNPPSQKEAGKLLAALKEGLKSKVEVVVCPPFIYLQQALDFFCHGKKSQVKVGAQDCFWENPPTGGGAFTGEISPAMLKDLKVKYVIVGHSERRYILGEKDEVVNKKLRAALKANLSPIFCIGETAEQRKKGEAFKVLERQIRQGLTKLAKSQIEKVIIAYEPVWAISTNNPCSPDDALTANLFIRKVISKIFNKKAGRNIKILYGGSVNAQNAADYLSSNWLNGLLVGDASLNAKEFLQIIDFAVK